MARVTFTSQGQTFEAEVSVAELKELAGLNGHRLSPARAAAQPLRPVEGSAQGKRPDINALLSMFSERARKLFHVLRTHPKGIEAKEICESLKLKNPNQVAGLIGPAATIMRDQGYENDDLFTTDLTFPNGVRRRMYYPGKLLLGYIEKPA
jgi:hypothetical protein